MKYLLFGIMVVLTGCTFSPEADYKDAECFCAIRGGISVLYSDGRFGCKDGVYVSEHMQGANFCKK